MVEHFGYVWYSDFAIGGNLDDRNLGNSRSLGSLGIELLERRSIRFRRHGSRPSASRDSTRSTGYHYIKKQSKMISK